MHLEYTHDSDYFFFSQLLMRHIESYIRKHPDADNAIFDLRDIYEVFREDFAATTTNLESILNIADSYKVETLNGDQALIKSYKIDVKNNSLLLDFNSDALTNLRSGHPLIEPDSSIHE
ncbi:hypothetical protein GWP85_05780 [Acinetobacter beijerinckii]|uniref:hypothetical protein n=1 Tax=Acinetobacter TaxID=469 RepID=UPI0020C8BAFA|nr:MULTISPECIES: hypothetical protein [Acinetobacter]MDF2417026.1 hypothetical protein [Acinetobacter beijerinckii]UTO18876.1 hypothetical protein NGC85_13200 [Acinetobacter sp. Z1]